MGIKSPWKHIPFRIRRNRKLLWEEMGFRVLRKLSVIMGQIRRSAHKTGLKPSFCYYKRWGVKKKHGHRPVILLRFSKSGKPEIEKAYATHYVDIKKIEQLKKDTQDRPTE